MKRALYVFWQEPKARRWYPVGVLSRRDSMFRFAYTRGAKLAKKKEFLTFGRMTELHQQYESHELFPFFANRLLSPSRPEYQSFLTWLEAESESPDPLELLARTGGIRATDSILLYPKPEPTANGEYDLRFFVHGLRHMPKEAIPKINTLSAGTKLFPLFDDLNPFDREAVALRTDDPPMIVGYVPRFFAHDIRRCIRLNRGRDISVRVRRVNEDAPLQFRLLCRFVSRWPQRFNPCSGPEFQPIARELVTA